MKTDSITSKLNKLPHHIQQEVIDYVEFLEQKYQQPQAQKRLQFDWEGGLREMADQCSSVALQHKSLEWR